MILLSSWLQITWRTYVIKAGFKQIMIYVKEKNQIAFDKGKRV